MIDLHCHILPGVDDGPPTTAGSLEMARAAWEGGIRTMVATPHMMDRYPANTPAHVAEAAERLQTAIGDAGVPLRVLPGGEIALEHLARMGETAVRAATLGGGGRWLLLEMPFRGWPLQLAEVLRDLENRGLGAVLAHPERAEAVQRNPERLRDLVGRGALVQITAMSLTGDNGVPARRTAEKLLRDGTAHFIATDAHSAKWRPPLLAEGVAAAAAALGTEPGELSWMVDEGPRLVVEGRAVRPPRLSPARTPPAASRPGRGAPPRRPRR